MLGYIFLGLVSLIFLTIAWWYMVQYEQLKRYEEKVWAEYRKEKRKYEQRD